MTLLLPSDRTGLTYTADDTTRPIGSITAPTISQRVVGRAGDWLSRRRDDRGRRSFLQRAAMVGTALAVNPFDFILKPQSAYASICGPANECSQGWTAFCCTVNGGANTCPDGSYAAGWWKVTSSAFCRGGDRYIVDCNRLPSASCSCRCATGSCDRRRVCCNNFRYGQCNQQIPGVTQVVCRVIICTPPWEWDNTCTTTVRTDNRTRDHSAPCLPGTNPTEIEITYQDLGLVGSILGSPTGPETAGPDGGSWRAYTNGVISRVITFGIVVLPGSAGVRYAELDGPNGPLGYLTGEPVDVTALDGTEGRIIPAQNGALYETPDLDGVEVFGPIDDAYNLEGGPSDWLGFPVTGVVDAPGGRQRVDFTAPWSLVHDPSTDETRLVPIDVELPDTAGEWPDTAGVARWSGGNRIETAIEVSVQSLPDGASMAVLAAADSFADALSGGVLAAMERGPVLLTGSDGLAEATLEELRRLDVERIVLIGGTSALSTQVEDDLADALPDVELERLSGDGRFATAVAVSQVIAPEGAEVVYMTSGRAFPDALTASPAAVRDGAPLLLTEPTELPDVTAVELQRLQPSRVVLVGGEAAVDADTADAIARASGADVERIAGPSRFDTAAALVVEGFSDPVSTVMIATGEEFADALAAGAASVTTNTPLLLVAGQNLVPPVTRREIERLEPDLIVVVGGDVAVIGHVARQLAAIPTGAHETREP